MPATLYFPHAFHLGLGPGRAAAIRAGDVIRNVPDELAPRLRERFGARDQDPKDVETIEILARMLPDEVAAKSSHHLDPKMLEPSKEKALTEHLADQSDAIRTLAAAIEKKG